MLCAVDLHDSVTVPGMLTDKELTCECVKISGAMQTERGGEEKKTDEAAKSNLLLL